MEQNLNNKKENKNNPMYKLFNYIEKYAHSKYKIHILFWVCFFEQSFSLIPPDILIVPIAMYKKYTALKVALFASFATMLGGLVTYALAYYYGQAMIDYFSLQSFLETTRIAYNDNVFWAMFFAAFTPIPDKIFTILGGAFKVALFPMLAALFLGKFIRYYIVGYIAENYGERARDVILKRMNIFLLYMSLSILIIILLYYKLR